MILGAISGVVPQVDWKNTPQSMDAAGECFVYD